MPHRLVTIAFSHYNEKARWALDWCGIPYRESRYMPGFSQLAVLVATRGRGGSADDVSTKLSTPVLVKEDGTTLCDSTAIARWASATVGPGDGPLFPGPEVLDLVDRFGRELGPATRLAAYRHAFESTTAMRTMARRNVGRLQATAFELVSPVGKVLMRKALGITEARGRRAVERVRRLGAEMGDRLSKSAYLVGDRFTAADLTFAALMSPVLMVTREEGYSAAFPDITELGAEAADLVAEMRASRAGAFAVEMFRRHRRARTPG